MDFQFLANNLVCCDTVMEPFAREILARWPRPALRQAQEPIPLILDQTKVSDRHQILMLSVRWGERALPLAWRVAETEGTIGLAPQKESLEVVAGWRPADLGCFCSPTASPQTRDDPVVSRSGMGLSLRLKSNLVARWGTTRTTTGGRTLLSLSKGRRPRFEAVVLTGKHVTTHIGIVRDPGYDKPWLIAMSEKPGYLTTLDDAVRWGIEPMVSDFKSRGFGLEQSQLRRPDRLAPAAGDEPGAPRCGVARPVGRHQQSRRR